MSNDTGDCSDCARYRTELNDARAMIVQMESNHAETVKEWERKYNDEVASMQTLLDEAAAEATSLTSRKFEQERNKLFENTNEMESEIKRLRRLVVESGRTQQALLQQQQQQQLSPNRNHNDTRDSNLSSNSVQQYEEEIEMLKIQLATANQEITKLTLEKEKLSKAALVEAEAKQIPLATITPKEAEILSDRLASSETQAQELLAKLARSESDVTAIRSVANETIEKLKVELNKLREKFQSVVEINRRLALHYAKKSREMREEEINLPPTFDELLSTALMLREQVILERANREVLKEKSSQEIDLLRSELLAEQNERQQMEQLLSQQIEALQHDLAKERSLGRSQSMQAVKLHAADEPAAMRKSATGIPESEFEALKQAKAALEVEVQRLRQQCACLQVELDTSESVQQDLVRLSQSLQVSLENMRDQSEVRWEFDDEVDQCRGCKKSLPVSQQKRHCRHCGKVFCDSCLGQSVPTGAARRPAHVCSQCHFLLVNEAKPYFTSVTDQ